MENRSFWKDPVARLIAISSFLWGIAAHGMALTNKYSFHDDVPWFNGVGETYGLGRWFLGISGKITEAALCSKNYSLPLFNGLIGLVFIAVIVYLLCRKLEIKNRFVIVAVCGVFIAFPAVTSSFAYIFTLPYYLLGALLSVAGAYLFYTYMNIPSFIACTLMMALSTGLYQSNIAISLSVLLLFMFQKVYVSEMTWKDYFMLAIKNAAVCAAFMAVYFAVNAITLKVTGLSMYDYKGVSSFGTTSPAGYISRIVLAYKRFLKPADFINYNGVSVNMFPWNLKYLHIVMIILVLVVFAVFLKDIGQSKKTVQLLILAAILPLFAYFIYVMVEQEHAHGGMAFAEAFTFVFAAYVLEHVQDSQKVLCRLKEAVIVVMFIMAVMFVRYSNVCYLKIHMMQAQAINYYDTLIARIQMTPGYTKETPVAYIGPRSKNDEDFSGNTLFDPIYLPPYQGNSIINDFAWEETMNMWCGFSRVEAYEPDITDMKTVEAMPCYPSEGSVKMVDGILVVKFADE